MKRSFVAFAAIAASSLLLYAAPSDGKDAQSVMVSPNTAHTIGFTPWLPLGFKINSALIATGTRLPAGAVRLPELRITGTFESLPVEIHEYMQVSKVGQSGLFVDDPRAARVISVWPADHAILDRSGRVIGLLAQRGPVHFDFYLANPMSMRNLRAFMSLVIPHA